MNMYPKVMVYEFYAIWLLWLAIYGGCMRAYICLFYALEDMLCSAQITRL